MMLLFALQESAECLDALASARAVAEVAGWDVRILRVPVAAGYVEVPEELAQGAEIVDLGDDPQRAILAAAEQPDVGALGFCLAGEKCANGGALADALLRTVPAPLLIGRSGTQRISAVKKILVPLEGSPSSSVAMSFAENVFCGRGRELIALHVVTSDVPTEPGSLPAPRMLDQEHYEWQSWQEEFTMRFALCPKGGRHRIMVKVGDPKELISKTASELGVDLVVAAWNRSLAAGHCERVKALLASCPCLLLLVSAPTALAL